MCALALTFVTCSCPPATCPTSCRLNHAVAASPLQPRPAGDQRLMLLIGLSSHCFLLPRHCAPSRTQCAPSTTQDNARRKQRRYIAPYAKPCPVLAARTLRSLAKGPPPLCDTRRAPCAARRRTDFSHPIILRIHIFLRSATTDFSVAGGLRVHVNCRQEKNH